MKDKKGAVQVISKWRARIGHEMEDGVEAIKIMACKGQWKETALSHCIRYKGSRGWSDRH